MENDAATRRNDRRPIPLTRITDQERTGTSTLPALLTSFIGRSAEQNRLIDLLTSQRVRLVMLIGPGGVGKTRLALEVAPLLHASFPDGVHFMPLSSITNPDQMTSAITRLLDVRESGSRTTFEALKNYLAPRKHLLVLDNLEQIAGGGDIIAEILAECPHVSILGTSRTPMRLYGEHLLNIPPLSLPNSDEEGASGSERSEAIDLFVDRARAAFDDFALTPANSAAVRAICQRLDGLPLAIELAAARLRILPLATIHDMLEKPLSLLVDGAQDMPERLRTMRNAIEWSYKLLSPANRAFFRRTAVFASGFALTAAGVVTRTEDDLGLDPLAAVTALIDASLLRRDPFSPNTPRYRMLQVIREFALEQLAKTHEETEARNRHAAYFLGQAELVEASWIDRSPGTDRPRLDYERDNIATALEWFRSQADTERGLRMVGALWQVWFDWGDLLAARAQIRRVLEEPDAHTFPAAWAKAVGAEGAIAQAIGDHAAARSLNEAALAVLEELQDNRGSAAVLNSLGLEAMVCHEFDRAEQLLTESYRRFREAGDTRAGTWSLRHLGSLAFRRGDMVTALERASEGLRLVEHAASASELAGLHHTLGMVKAGNGDWRGAEAEWETSLWLFQASGARWGVANVLASLGNVADETGDSERARTLWSESLALYRAVGDPEGTELVLGFLGWSAREAGDLAGAEHYFREAATIAVDESGTFRDLSFNLGRAALRIDHAEAEAAATLLGEGLASAIAHDDPVTAAANVAWIAHLIAQDGQRVRATEQLGAVDALLTERGVRPSRRERSQHEDIITMLRQQLGDKSFLAAWQRGQSLPFADAIQAATDYLASVRHTRDTPGAVHNGLTQREMDVLRLLANDAHLTDREIAAALFISPRTVGSHVSSVLHKLGVETRRGIREYARTHDLI